MLKVDLYLNLLLVGGYHDDGIEFKYLKNQMY
jgi:hypothetical protein